ncbi:hypothetical protein [Herbaspirillum sp. CAH-3]|uniref:hypothetical protein n=1 Tax=Herbaspirillum sp. CAH-3 TaxID=2605746 RepID=UPI0012AC6620|nr:hypothetical protein [Herbaspirillum sp. CAH-3]MRT30845.1 hypothetical protein [Herbaspirillum sp. CAH-3]
MALTKDERRALELARIHVANGTEYICVALDDVSVDTGIDVSRLKEYCDVSLGLGKSGSLWTWQNRNGFADRGYDGRRADRLAWIDWMLGKPLPGEKVEIIWFSKDAVHSTAEYCGREFYAKRWIASTSHDVFEKTESRGMVKVCEGDDFAKINAAIVAHVWPAT